MQKFSKEVKVGIFTVVTIVMFIIGMNYLKGTSFFQTRIYLNAKYKQIDGLMVGAKIMYNGYQLGQVRDIVIDPQTKDIIVSFDIADMFPIPKNSTAMIYSTDFLGTRGIQLLLGNASETCVTGDFLKDSIAVGAIDKAMTEIEPVKIKLTATLDEVNKLAKSIRNVIEDSTNYRLQTILANFQKTTHNLVAATQKLPNLTQKIDTMLTNTNELIASFNQQKQNIWAIVANVKTLSDSLAAGSSSIKQLMQNAQNTLQQLQQIAQKINQGDGTIAKFLSTDEFHKAVVETTQSLNALLIEFKEHPKRFVHFSLFGKKDKPQNSLPSNKKQ